MKSRAQLMDHSEDWVDGSWTVDCVCGVNFDDGEEMVDCDECGVWVHTRCSRYVKGEKSFACDKCKIKNSRNISEETEVAQLLVDFPNNTLKLEEDSYRFNDVSARRPIRLWTEKPMEDRVHVHGIPGGDPQLFTGLSGIFTPQLWKATGYVPKKFNFRYKEFPCWETDDDEKSGKDPQENSSPVDTGADALYSMSKETVCGTRLRIPLGTRVSGKGENFDSKADVKESKRLRHANPDADNENEKNTRQSYLFNSSQQRKGLIASQYRTGKRKGRALDKDIGSKKRVRHSSGTVFSTASTPKINDASVDKDAKFFRNNSQIAMKFSEVDEPHAPFLKSKFPREHNFVKEKYSHVLKASPSNTDNCNSTTEVMLKAEKVHNQSSAFIKADVTIYSSLISNIKPTSLKKEVCGSVTCFDTDQTEKSADVMINKADDELSTCFMQPAVPQSQEIQNSQDSIVGTCVQTQQLKLDLDALPSNIKMSGDGLKHLIKCSAVGPDSVNCKVDVASVSSSQCSDKESNLQANSIAVGFNSNASDKFNDTCIASNMEGSEGCKSLKVPPLENKRSSVQAENFLETGEVTHSPALLCDQRKIVFSVARSMSANSVFKSVASDDSKAEETRNSSISNRKKATTDGNLNITKERGAVSIAIRDGEKHHTHPKESPRASESSVWKRSNLSKISHSHTSKESYSRSKEHESRSFAKAKQDNIVTSDSGESAGSLQAQGASNGQSKVTSSGSSGSLQKVRKHNQITNNTSSKTSNIASTNRHLLSASHAALSDEELALLLHQELNSSPRVPRIPRMRQAGSLPQSASSTATNMLSKRTSGVGGNDHTSVSRRKYKESSEDGIDVKTRKGERGSSSQNQNTNESSSKVDRINKRELEERSSKTYGVVKRKGTSSINVMKSHSSSRNSLESVFDEEIGIGESPTYRTLPGLISEIMSKGKRMTYEELCNAVLPHWHNLRKHNGERYAYSSHSQAVLDCLRNRSEWAQLVDRGPKTNPGRKRRKLDAEPATSESEDAMIGKNRVPKVLDNKNLPKQHDFPKGKRKARKRRRQVLQSREVKNLQKSRSAETASEDDDGEDDSPYSYSVEQSSSSEDEDDDDQGIGSGGTASETSMSTDES